jgi:DNA (cytosine-5)-methyltransferase 1
VTNLTVGSLFTGVGGFDLGMEHAGWTTAWQVEWDRHCQSVLARHWPDVPRWSDVCDVDGAMLPPVDCITFGSPCQDLSVAGKRAGLDGERSGLFFQAVRIIREMRDATEHAFPRWAVWENVAGALSSNGGADFGAVLNALADAGALVLEWAVLDARWFGVPQRRRRVFVVACFDPATAARCPDPLLPVWPRSGWHPPTSDEKGQEVAGTLGGGAGSRGWAPDTDRMTFVPVAFNPTGIGKWAEGVGTLRARDAKGDATVLAFSHSQGLDCQPSDEAWPTLRSGGGGHAVLAPTLTAGNDPSRSPQSSEITQQVAAVLQAQSQVRRLTPVECERLMGWPDDHTRWTADGTEIADSHRYRMAGNGVASPVAAWIGKHLADASKGNP